MNKLVFDIETTGLPKKQKGNKYYPYNNFEQYDSARIISFASILLSKNNEVIEKKYFVIKPNKFEIKNSHIHGITQEYALDNGVDINNISDYLKTIIDSIDVIIAHNIIFDYNILLSELGRMEEITLINKFQNKKQYCTMKNSINLCKLKRKYNGGFKYPSLMELYKFAFNTTFEGAHNAQNDTEATMKCYIAITNNIELALLTK